MLLLLLLLQASLVHRSLQEVPQLDEFELFANFKEFPIGSLLTIYFKHIPTTLTPIGFKNAIDIDLYEDFSQHHARLHFRLEPTSLTRIVSNVWFKNNTFKLDTEQKPETYHAPVPEPFVRFDLYKLSDTQYLPFFQGFSAGIRTMVGVAKPTSVHMKSHVSNLAPLNFDKDDVYLTLRPANQFAPTMEWVLHAFEQAYLGNHRTEYYHFATRNTGFLVGQKMKMSLLMLSRPVPNDVPEGTDKNFATMYFLANSTTWTLGVLNKWDPVAKKVKLYLFHDDAYPPIQKNTGPADRSVECGPGITTSTDLVHLKFERPSKNTIKMRVYYRGSAGGVTCEINVGDKGATSLDGIFFIRSVQSATVLHFSDFY